MRRIDTPIGKYESTIAPSTGEILNEYDGQWIVTKVQHDIQGRLKRNDDDNAHMMEFPKSEKIVVYVKSYVEPEYYPERIEEI